MKSFKDKFINEKQMFYIIQFDKKDIDDVKSCKSFGKFKLVGNEIETKEKSAYNDMIDHLDSKDIEYKNFTEMMAEGTDKAPAEWRVALGMIKRYFGKKVPTDDELEDVAKDVAKNGKIEDFKQFYRWVETQVTVFVPDMKA